MIARNYASQPGKRSLLYLALSRVASAAAVPVKGFLRRDANANEAREAVKSFASENLPYIIVAIVLILAGGAFAGLTIALMGQDGVYLEVIATSGEGKERKHADKVRRLLSKGKHWVLVTLLLANVIVNETLPVVLDRMGGGGWVAVALSSTAIVIFGEIIPQSICVRYGMAIGAFMAPYVYALMLILSPIGYPVARLLDWSLGHDHGTVYKKTGLKTLVDLHRTMGVDPDNRLNQDEVTIIKAVLDLKEKSVSDIMTPMDDVFTMSADTVLDEDTINRILSAGYSRIPIYKPGSELNFVGMLLVKILITYDPEDKKKVSEFALATLPETRPETSCLDIINFFQEGKSHMVLVSENPGEDYGATGVVTLEDVIEELIGEEIIDESDVYIDVHKAIRRLAPAPYAKIRKEGTAEALIDVDEERCPRATDALLSKAIATSENSSQKRSASPKTTFLMRRTSNNADGVSRNPPLSIRGNIGDMREHLKHLGPSNLASRPKNTRYQNVKIKPGNLTSSLGTNAENKAMEPVLTEEPYTDEPTVIDEPAAMGGEGAGLLTRGKGASDGVEAFRQGYGTINNQSSALLSPDKQLISFDGELPAEDSELRTGLGRSDSDDTLGELRSRDSSPTVKQRICARSGGITENIVDVGGIRKVILETTSSGDDDDVGKSSSGDQNTSSGGTSASGAQGQGGGSSKGDGGKQVNKKRRNRKKKSGK